ncbi:hypothetical protein M2157_000497 [Streptomyces sp. SAI-127]|nr:hypothetical protein [Streptomyces sp. SAI-127]
MAYSTVTTGTAAALRGAHALTAQGIAVKSIPQATT